MAIAPTNLQESLEAIFDENKQLKVGSDQKERLLEQLRAENEEIKARLAKLEIFSDIIEEEPKAEYLIRIKNTTLWKQVKIRTAQVFGMDKTGDMYRVRILEACLEDGLFLRWPFIRKKHFNG